MPIFVVDASVALKWFITEEEPYSHQASQFLHDLVSGKLEVITAPHFFSEVANTLYRKQKKIASRALVELLNLDITTVYPTEELIKICESLISKYQLLSFYDTFYHSIAIANKGLFVTADAKYLNTTHREGHILLLKDWE